MVGLPDYDDSVYVGVWTNWEHGRILGTTLTMTRAHGNLLIAFTSLFVTVVGTSFWRISCFVLHYIYSTKASQDGLYHQRQAILRNAANGATGLWGLFQIFNAWRKTARNPYRRILPLLAFTSITLVTFALTSIYSSRISTATGNQVLLAGSGCGKFDIWSNPTDNIQIWGPSILQTIGGNATYAQECYPNGVDGVGCGKFVKNDIPAKVNGEAGCPFDPKICKSQDSNLLIDTGFIDSRADLGINTQQSGRFLYKRLLHCAPLSTMDDYARKSRANTSSGGEEDVMQYFYGEFDLGDRTQYTYQYPLHQYPLPTGSSDSGMNDFTMRIMQLPSAHGSWGSYFTPIRELRRENSTTVLVFLSTNRVVFMGDSGDIWYSTRTPFGNESDGFGQLYVGDEPASPLGCALQHQICNPNLRPGQACTPLHASWPDGRRHLPKLWPDDADREAVEWSYDLLLRMEANIAGALGKLGASGLDSGSLRADGVQAPIAGNQWQLDVRKLHNISMAGAQRQFVDAATGPSSPQMRALSSPPNGRAEELCKNQVIRSNVHTNFSVFELALVFVIGGLVVALSWTLEPLVNWILARRDLDIYAHFEWNTNETLQLQRLAHERLEVSSVSGRDKRISVAGRRDRAAAVDLEDMTLEVPPRLSKKMTSNLEEEVGFPHGADEDDERGATSDHDAFTSGRESESSHRPLIFAESTHRPFETSRTYIEKSAKVWYLCMITRFFPWFRSN